MSFGLSGGREYLATLYHAVVSGLL